MIGIDILVLFVWEFVFWVVLGGVFCFGVFDVFVFI